MLCRPIVVVISESYSGGGKNCPWFEQAANQLVGVRRRGDACNIAKIPPFHVRALFAVLEIELVPASAKASLVNEEFLFRIACTA